MAATLDLISFAMLTLGGFCVFVGGVGVLRMPDLYTRMHAASVTDTAGMGLVIAGLLLQAGWSLALVKLLTVFVFLYVTSPTAAYALANAALLSGHEPEDVEDRTGAGP
ncbi:MAG: monovalent cation/H(+) antiporter subunit G [Pseudomonadales bacterium]